MSRRKEPNKRLKKILLKKNKNVCCVCKRHGIGLNFHHIDGNAENTVEENLAVLCVEDHDSHHRPNRYVKMKHSDLSRDQIKQCKESWEAFVEEAAKPNTKVIGFLVAYGIRGGVNAFSTEEDVNTFENGDTVAIRLSFQWEKLVMYERFIERKDMPLHTWMGKLIEVRDWLGKDIWITIIPKTLPVAFCEKCLSNGIDDSRLDPHLYSSIIKRHTDDSWNNDSWVSIYMDPHVPLLTFAVLLREEFIHGVYIYKQGKNIRCFCTEPLCGCHYSSYEQEKMQENVEKTLEDIILDLLKKWMPSKFNFFTFEKDSFVLLDNTITFHHGWHEDHESDLFDLLNRSNALNTGLLEHRATLVSEKLEDHAKMRVNEEAFTA